MTDTGVLVVLHTLALVVLAATVVVLVKRLWRIEERLDDMARELHGLYIRKPTTREK